MHPTLIAGFVALFVAVGGAFLAVNLLVGWLVRPRAPNAEKLEVYECGEPTIGSSFVQFDLRFYVVALLFIIFDVEVALFFPWATVFGKATHLTDPTLVAATADGAASPAAAGVLRELGLREPAQATAQWSLARAGSLLARTALVDMAAFFAVLLAGFAYVWYRGDLDWVRAVSAERSGSAARVATR
jgi:NADH-quinone oxidoreductase subunit A